MQILIVVDLAIINHPQRPVFVRDGLMSAGEVDDTQAAHAEGAAPVDVIAAVVGTAITDLIAHPLDSRLLRPAARENIARNATHSLIIGQLRHSQQREFVMVPDGKSILLSGISSDYRKYIDSRFAWDTNIMSLSFRTSNVA